MERPTTMLMRAIDERARKRTGRATLRGVAIGLPMGFAAAQKMLRARRDAAGAEVPPGGQAGPASMARPPRPMPSSAGPRPMVKPETATRPRPMGRHEPIAPPQPAGAFTSRGVRAPAVQSGDGTEGSIPTAGGDAFGSTVAGSPFATALGAIVTGGGEALSNAMTAGGDALTDDDARPAETPIASRRFRNRESGISNETEVGASGGRAD